MTEPPTAPELFTFEESHELTRLTAPRLSAVGTVPAEREPSEGRVRGGRFGHGNKEQRKRGAKRALRRAYAEARERCRKARSAAANAAGEGAELPTSDKLLADAFHVHMAGMAELGSSSIFVQAHSLIFAVESVLHGLYIEAAAAAGFLTDRGMALKEQASNCATQSARAMTAALAAAKALGGRKAARGNAVTARIERNAQRILETQGRAVSDGESTP